MLGLGKEKSSWHWTICGKHPIAADYFRSGTETPLQEAFAVWVEEGFAAMPDSDEARHAICIWRFWVRGAKKGSLICGVLKASSDRIGRPYPLLIIGVGGLNGWEKHWAYLPAVLGEIWQHVEYVTSRRYENLEELLAAIRMTAPPPADMPGALAQLNFENNGTAPDNTAETSLEINSLAKQLNESQQVRIPINANSQAAHDQPVLWGLRLKGRGVEIPQALFIGGKPGQQSLMLFMRSLNQADFVNLWSV